MMTETRYAIYAVPPLGSILKRAGDAWLGRDPDLDEPVPHPVVDGIAPERLQAITAAPRQYGFHGTLKAPFVLEEGRAAGDLHEAVRVFAQGRRPFSVRLKVDALSGFLALVPAEPSPELAALANDCVEQFDAYRAPLNEHDRTRRRPDRLSERERAHLERWGYPYVFEDFRFHMTLTERLEEPEHRQLRAILERAFASVLAEPLRIDQVALFVQTHRVAPFRVAARFPFGG